MIPDDQTTDDTGEQRTQPGRHDIVYPVISLLRGLGHEDLAVRLVRREVEADNIEETVDVLDLEDVHDEIPGTVEPCPTCQQSGFDVEDNGQLVPVWEDVEDYEDGAGPDYVGCTECHTMERVGDE